AAGPVGVATVTGVPAHPTKEAQLYVGGDAWDVAFGNGVIYVANDGRGLSMVRDLPPLLDGSKISMSSNGTSATVTGVAGAIIGTGPFTVTISVTNGATATGQSTD